ncbi:hypothetical protein H312_00097 [Anncaliia algerae PRA339]|uniref:Uncharacterized protein n=1 Tax=Anncaliia algerae PRA339 TaxID=1288291 RepID=A0A059F605_9MICR|nr:hypothetical protein H312_00097 [Anncaliia algerae PRA339]
MQSSEYKENKCPQLSNVEFTYFLMMEGLLKKESSCNYCMTPMKLVSYKKNKDGISRRCMNSLCLKYKVYASIRRNSFFESFSTSLSAIFKVLAKYAVRQPQHSIKDSIDLNDCTKERIIKNLLNSIPETDFETCKLGGPGKIVQIDEAMINLSVKVTLDDQQVIVQILYA